MRKSIPVPLEYVVSRMKLIDDNGGVAIGYVVSPRYENETDERFCGRQGNLDIRIVFSTRHRSDAYEYIQEELGKMKAIDRLVEQMEENDDDDDEGED